MSIREYFAGTRERTVKGIQYTRKSDTPFSLMLLRHNEVALYSLNVP